MSFLLAHVIAFWWYYFDQCAVQLPWLPEIDVRHQIAFLMPLVSLVIFSGLHLADHYCEDVRGLWGRARRYGPDPGDYAAAAITRLSLHSALAGGAIWGIVSQFDAGAMREFPVTALALALLLGTFAALCYSQAHRWTSFAKPEVLSPRLNTQLRGKRDLLKKASAFDQCSWYALTTGFIWTLAVPHPGLALGANFLLGLLLWFYYFEFPAPKERDPGVSYPLDDKQIQEAVQARAKDAAVPGGGPTKFDQWKKKQVSAFEGWLEKLIP